MVPNFCKGGDFLKSSDTNNLKQALMESASLDDFLTDNREKFNNETLSDMLNGLLDRRGLSKASLARQAGISEVYLHQIFAGKRSPSRNRLLCLCYGLEASLDECQELLKLCSLAQLYPKNCRDAIITYGIVHNVSLFEINDRLFTENEETLF